MKYFGFSDSTEFSCLYVGQGRIVGHKHITRTLDEYEFFLINSGDLFIEQGGEKFHLKKGDFFLSEKNVSYGGHEPSDVDFLWLHFVVKKGDEEFTETPKFKYVCRARTDSRAKAYYAHARRIRVLFDKQRRLVH